MTVQPNLIPRPDQKQKGSAVLSGISCHMRSCGSWDFIIVYQLLQTVAYKSSEVDGGEGFRIRL